MNKKQFFKKFKQHFTKTNRNYSFPHEFAETMWKKYKSHYDIDVEECTETYSDDLFRVIFKFYDDLHRRLSTINLQHKCTELFEEIDVFDIAQDYTYDIDQYHYDIDRYYDSDDESYEEELIENAIRGLTMLIKDDKIYICRTDISYYEEEMNMDYQGATYYKLFKLNNV